MSRIQIADVSISEKKGTIKRPVQEIQLTHKGIPHDAHAYMGNRQISLLGIESIEKYFQQTGKQIAHGEFAENITTQGMLLYHFKPLDRLINDSVELEVTQIGKECYGKGCAIYEEVGNCIMPQEGIFARTIKEGSLRKGDELVYLPRTIKVLALTLSDRAAQGIYPDKSGALLENLCSQHFEQIERTFSIDRQIIPDDRAQLQAAIQKATENYDITITTGSTGIGERDIAPDIIRPLLDKEIPGIMEMIRLKYGADKPKALLSRSVAGVKGKSLLFCLPGSPNAVREYLSEILPTVEHALYMLHGLDVH